MKDIAKTTAGRLNNGVPQVPPPKSTSEETATFQQHLPITAHKEEIINMINDNKVLLIVGNTGSGKTTQVGIFFSYFSTPKFVCHHFFRYYFHYQCWQCFHTQQRLTNKYSDIKKVILHSQDTHSTPSNTTSSPKWSWTTVKPITKRVAFFAPNPEDWLFSPLHRGWRWREAKK